MDADALPNLKRQLSEVEAFLLTAAYRARQKTVEADIASLETSILAQPPVDEKTRGEVLLLYGRRHQLVLELSFFEDARDTLKAAIEKILDDETKLAIDKTE